MMISAEFPHLTLVLGGASSGKSLWAEGLVLSSNRSPVYLATAEPSDREMSEKIVRHQERREENWQLIESPIDLAPYFKTVSSDHVILLDCLTLWLSNLMMAEKNVDFEITNLLESIANCSAPVVCVSNEIGLGMVPDNTLGRRFRDWQGQINQRFAAAANAVTFVAAGLPLVLKAPEGTK